MKTKFTLLITCILTIQFAGAQVSTPANSGSFGDYVGWDAFQFFPVKIRHRGNYDIDFYTNDLYRMRLTRQGYLSVGQAVGFTPAAMLTVNSCTPQTENVFRTESLQGDGAHWQMLTGTGQTAQQPRFSLRAATGTAPWIDLQSYSNGMRFSTSASSGAPAERLRINGNNPSANINGYTMNTSGFLGVCADPIFYTTTGSAATPYSLLHLMGTGGNTQQSGYRDWMKDGIVFTSNADLAYIGQRKIGATNDVTEYVLAWGDNSNISAVGPDDFCLRFTGGTGTSSGINSSGGLQMFRATAEANGRVGIGDEFDASANNRPSRRLHVHDPGGDNANNSQLRISQNFQNAYVDFRTTTPS